MLEWGMAGRVPSEICAASQPASGQGLFGDTALQAVLSVVTSGCGAAFHSQTQQLTYLFRAPCSPIWTLAGLLCITTMRCCPQRVWPVL